MPEISPLRECWHRPDRVKRCIMCGEERALGDFNSYAYTTNQGKRSLRYESRCVACNKARRAERYAKTQDSGQKWKAANRDRISDYNRRRQQDPEVRALKAYHQRLRKARMRSGQGDSDEIREIYRRAKYIERVVKDCPVFALSEIGHKMHVDHIVPLSKGGKHEASNLQILPIGLNIRKGVTVRA